MSMRTIYQDGIDCLTNGQVVFRDEMVRDAVLRRLT